MDCLTNELTPLALYQLRQTNKCFNTISDEDIKRACVKEINQRLLTIFGNNVDEFKRILTASHAVISGSFIIQCLLGEQWTDSDIDIFVPTKNAEPFFSFYDKVYTELDSFLNRLLLPPIDNTCFQYTDKNVIKEVRTYASVQDIRHYRFYLNSSNDCIKLLTDHLNGQLIITDYHMKSKLKPYKTKTLCDYHALKQCEQEYQERIYGNKTRKIQIIQVDVEPTSEAMHQYIRQSFDFDICKNIFMDNQLTIDHLGQIMNKKTQFKTAVRVDWHRSIARCERYSKRGFDMLIKPLSVNELSNYITILDDQSLLQHNNRHQRQACHEQCIIRFCNPEQDHVHFEHNQVLLVNMNSFV